MPALSCPVPVIRPAPDLADHPPGYPAAADAHDFPPPPEPRPASPPYNGRPRLLRADTYRSFLRAPDHRVPIHSVADYLRGNSPSRAQPCAAAFDTLDLAWLGTRRAVDATVRQLARLLRGAEPLDAETLTRVNGLYERIESALETLPLSPEENALVQALTAAWDTPHASTVASALTSLRQVAGVGPGQAGWLRLLQERPRNPLLFPHVSRFLRHLHIDSRGRAILRQRQVWRPEDLDPVPAFPEQVWPGPDVIGPDVIGPAVVGPAVG